MATLEDRTAEGEKVVAEDRQYLIHSWSVQSAIAPLAVAGGEGRYFWDYEGNRYLDFASQLVNLNIGHQHPKVVAAIKEQAEKLCTGGPHLEEILQYEGAHTVAAVILETVTGTNGIIVPPDGYLQAIREVCDRNGILLILDEVMAGWGRTGRWFACEHWNVLPDIITTAKGINSGYVPLGAMTVRDPVYEAIKDRFFAGGLTYSGHPLACAAAVGSIEAFREEGIVENAAAMGEVLREQLPRLAERHPSIGDVRGVGGLFFGLELVRDRATREPLVPYNAGGEAAAPVARLAKAALERGLYLFVHWNVVMIAPPLTITREELDEGLAILDEVLAVADEFYTG